jgi:alginate O-acetyltransferase complex protein AlgI
VPRDHLAGEARLMLFNSYVFILLFLPLTLLGFFAIAQWHSQRLAKFWLTLASYCFYAYWNPAYLPLLLGSVLVNFYCGSAITRSVRGGTRARSLLVLGVGGNLALLGYYKYAGFLVSTANTLTGLDAVIPNIVLPLGISFYTFTQIAYLVDAYREDLRHYDFLSYNLFINFFPQLIAGPLLLHAELMPQLQSKSFYRFNAQTFGLGLVWFGAGLAKKVLLADEVSAVVAPVFDNVNAVNFVSAWLGVLAYTLQLYFDFSGYSDMAIGLGLMFGLRLPVNFNSPYKATSIIDFWRRWHITLSRFLRDYLYIALGGNRHGASRRYGNLMLTMLLGGLWHGAGWSFVIWGALHGAYLMINHGWRQLGIRMPAPMAWLITFLAVVVGWVFFRASSASDAMQLLATMAGAKGFALPQGLERSLSGWLPSGISFVDHPGGTADLMLVALLLVCAVSLPNTQQILAGFQLRRRWAVGGGVLAALSLMSMNRVSEFLYFQF